MGRKAERMQRLSVGIEGMACIEQPCYCMLHMCLVGVFWLRAGHECSARHIGRIWEM